MNAGVPGLVTTIVPVYNRPEMLREAVASVLAQTWRPIEVIIVDDGSTDETGEAADSLARGDNRVRVLHLDHLGRIGLVREAGRRVARGEFIQYLDSDDLIAPEKFAVMVAALRTHPDRDVAYCSTRRYRLGDRPMDRAAERTGESVDRMLPGCMARRFWHTSTPLYRRSLLERVGPWTDLCFWEDIEYDVRIAAAARRLVHCPAFLTDFRDHGGHRASGLAASLNPELLEDAARAIAMICETLHGAGCTPASSDLRYALELTLMIRERCRAFGLDAAVARCDNVCGTFGQGMRAPPRLSFRAAISTTRRPIAAWPNEVVMLPVTVRNESTVSFRGGDFGVEIACHDANDPTPSPLTYGFHDPLAPGEARTISLPVAAPMRIGTAHVVIDLLWDGAVWFSELGAGTASAEIVTTQNPGTGPTRWSLRHEAPARAAAQFVEDGEPRVDVEIADAGSGSPWDVQLNTVIGGVRRGAHYALTLRMRASTARTVGLGVAMAHEPWDNLGCYHEIALSPAWSETVVHFEASADDFLARVHLDLGATASTVEVAALRVVREPGRGGGRQAPERSETGAGIVMYHAIIDAPLDVPHWCFLDVGRFRSQLRWLKASCDIVRLGDLPRAMAAADPARPAVALTFDDGFLNNYSIALPYLVELELPATVFVTTGLLDGDDSLWFCRVHHSISTTRLERFVWRGHPYDLRNTAARADASQDIAHRLKQLPAPRLRDEVAVLTEALGGRPEEPVAPDSPYRMLDRCAVKGLLASGLIDLGAHTRTHAILSLLPTVDQGVEIGASLDAVAALTGEPCRLFAYPNGRGQDFSASSVDLLRRMGVELAVTTIEALNDSTTPPLEMRRFGIGAIAPTADMMHLMAALGMVG